MFLFSFLLGAGGVFLARRHEGRAVMGRGVINPAKYRHFITIRDGATDGTRNEFYERTGSGTVLASVWAEKQDWSGKEIVEGLRETPMVYTKFVIRWRSDVRADMQVEYGGDVYRIDSVLDLDGVAKELVLFCKRDESL